MNSNATLKIPDKGFVARSALADLRETVRSLLVIRLMQIRQECGALRNRTGARNVSFELPQRISEKERDENHDPNKTVMPEQRLAGRTFNMRV